MFSQIGRRGVGTASLPIQQLFTLWDSLDAVRAFAGPDYETAVFYPEDDRFHIERDPTTTHYRVDTQILPIDASTRRSR